MKFFSFVSLNYAHAPLFPRFNFVGRVYNKEKDNALHFYTISMYSVHRASIKVILNEILLVGLKLLT